MSMIVGIDEVGRGPWAGPLVAAAVIWDDSNAIKGLTDSKLLSTKQRTTLGIAIKNKAHTIGLGWVSAKEIDALGLTQANRLAMLRALAPLECQGQEIIVDGNVDYLEPEYQSKAIIKADRSVPVVSAASIIAKVARDAYMEQISKLYPGYGFEAHVGYGTPGHIQSLETYGLTPLHRLLFKPVRQFSSTS